MRETKLIEGGVLDRMQKGESVAEILGPSARATASTERIAPIEESGLEVDQTALIMLAVHHAVTQERLRCAQIVTDFRSSDEDAWDEHYGAGCTDLLAIEEGRAPLPRSDD